MKLFAANDGIVFFLVLTLYILGLVTNYPPEGFAFDTLFFKQLVFVIVALLIIVIGPHIQLPLVRGSFFPKAIYVVSILSLVWLLLFAPEVNGAKSWFFLGPFSIQPVDFIKIGFVFVVAKYLATRHIHVNHIRHVVVLLSLLAGVFVLTFLQPDIGSAVTLLAAWVGIVFVSGVSKWRLVVFIILGITVFASIWQFLPEYQKVRLSAFTDPVSNLETSGYNTYQSKIAVGSGEIFGKGVGEGTQSKLDFLPLYESDFIFAAYAEELGFVGVLILFSLFIGLFLRLINLARRMRTNMESLFTFGFASLLFAHFFIHISVNVGILPVTGITLPFMSYGGSHIIAEAIFLAIVLRMFTISKTSYTLPRSGKVFE